jgi:hypothetical protein
MSRKEQLQMEEEESSNEQEENIRISKSTKASGTTRSKQNMRETGPQILYKKSEVVPKKFPDSKRYVNKSWQIARHFMKIQLNILIMES